MLTVLPQTRAAIQVQPYVSGLTAPVLVTSAMDGTARIFIVEQAGRVQVVQLGSKTPSVFLDLSMKVLYSGEQGLLGLAFHPNYAINGLFYVNYTRQPDGATVISRFHVASTNPNAAEPTETVLLTIPQPAANHNGGMLAFGPDGYLYIGMGDGGGANDINNYAQSLMSLLGKMLRIDVNSSSGTNLYSIPADNPFNGMASAKPEIYAYGLRNPWRWSFDRGSHQLYAGDAGQDNWEEVDIITKGGNYGWRVMEGAHCNPNINNGICSPPPNALNPLLEYGHTNGRCAIIGGYIYRGARSTFPSGAYIFGDYCSTEVLQLNPPTSAGTFSRLTQMNGYIYAFGEDESGELYLASGNGNVYQLVGSPAPGTCSYSMSPASQNFTAEGGLGSINVITALPDCAWLAASHNDWISIVTGTNGVGSGQITFAVAANTSPSQRVGTITAGGNAFTVTQDFSVALHVGMSGGNVVVSWPTNANGFQLESTSALTANPTWSGDSSTVMVYGTNYVVMEPLANGPKFYRLRKP